MPRARPETTTYPAAPRSRAIRAPSWRRTPRRCARRQCPRRLRVASARSPIAQAAAAHRQAPERRRVVRLANADEHRAEPFGRPPVRVRRHRRLAHPDFRCRSAARDSSGSCRWPVSAEPKWLIRSRNVAGPTLSERISRSQARRWRSERGTDRVRPSRRQVISPCPRSCFRCRKQGGECSGGV
jgi:hypothetical protein